MALGGKDALAKPLTRSTKGMLYARPPEVEGQLEELLHASADEQLARVKTADENSAQYVVHECLVYLVREAALAEDSDRYHALAAVMLKHVTRGIERKLWALGVANDDVEDVYQEVVSAMMTSILEGPSGEYFQVRFHSALYRQLLKSYDQYARRRRRAKYEKSLDAPEQKTDDREGERAATFGEQLESREDVATDVERRLLISVALEAISDPRHRKAFVLHHFYGWQIESTDPDEASLSELFDRTPRMVRNWLRTADRQLAEWRAAKRV